MSYILKSWLFTGFLLLALFIYIQKLNCMDDDLMKTNELRSDGGKPHSQHSPHYGSQSPTVNIQIISPVGYTSGTDEGQPNTNLEGSSYRTLQFGRASFYIWALVQLITLMLVITHLIYVQLSVTSNPNSKYFDFSYIIQNASLSVLIFFLRRFMHLNHPATPTNRNSPDPSSRSTQSSSGLDKIIFFAKDFFLIFSSYTFGALSSVMIFNGVYSSFFNNTISDATLNYIMPIIYNVCPVIVVLYYSSGGRFSGHLIYILGIILFSFICKYAQREFLITISVMTFAIWIITMAVSRIYKS